MYYSDKYSEIPNGIVNKQICGCGLSSFALENQDKLVLVVPNVSMIENKIGQYPNSRRSEEIFGLYGDVSPESLKGSIEYYLETVNIPKIMVTYDSFWKLIPHIDASYHIIVDEFQDLLDAYGYRSEAINGLISDLFFYDFPKLSFVSATPIKREYLPKELENLPYTELEWEDSVPVTVIPNCTKKPLSAVLNIITKYKLGLVEVKGHKSEAAYFYINSVTLIAQIIKKAGILPSEIRIICSKTPENKRKLKGYGISSSLDKERTFNFITSTCFKGSDIYSDTGISYIVSNSANINTLLTIDTDIYQIAGRIRNNNNPFKGLIYHIFNENPLKMTEEDFTNFVNRKIEKTNNHLETFRSINEEIRKKDFIADLRLGETYNYLRQVGLDSLKFDDILLSQEKRVYECIIKPYQSGLHVINTYKEEERYSVENDESIFEKSGIFLMSTNFVDVCRLVYQGKGNLIEARKQFPLLDKAYPILGMKGMYKLGFNTLRINNALVALDSTELIKSEIKKMFDKGFYLPKDVKVIIQSIYDNLGIIKTAKANDIESVLDIKLSSKKMDEKIVKGYFVK